MAFEAVLPCFAFKDKDPTAADVLTWRNVYNNSSYH